MNNQSQPHNNERNISSYIEIITRRQEVVRYAIDRLEILVRASGTDIDNTSGLEHQPDGQNLTKRVTTRNVGPMDENTHAIMQPTEDNNQTPFQQDVFEEKLVTPPSPTPEPNMQNLTIEGAQLSVKYAFESEDTK